MEKSIEDSKNRFPKVDLGNFGEEHACHFLKKKGFKIVHRNFRTKYGEIDIVARSGKIMIFVEVKTRSSIDFARPEEAVGFRKRGNLRTAARSYLQEHPVRGCEYRFDVLSVTVNDSLHAQLEWIQNAF
jgi:putative endonuclease